MTNELLFLSKFRSILFKGLWGVGAKPQGLIYLPNHNFRFFDKVCLLFYNFNVKGGFYKMAEAKKTTSKSKSTTKRISVTVEKDFYTELEEYTKMRCISVDEFVKKAIKEKLDSDRISTMIDFMTR